MARNQWIGGAAGVAQVSRVTISDVKAGDILGLIVGSISVTYEAIAANSTHVLAALKAAIDLLTSGPWGELTATLHSYTDEFGDTAYDYMDLTGPADGTPFTVTATDTNASGFIIIVTQLNAGTAGQNEKQRIILSGPPTGGTFTISYPSGGTIATTAALARNASAATIQTALEGLTGIGAGQATVTLNSASDWTIEFTGTLANTNVQRLYGSGASLTGAGGISVVSITESAMQTPESYDLVVDDSAASFRFKLDEPGGPYYSDWINTGGAGASAQMIETALLAIVIRGNTVAYTDVEVVGLQGGPYTIAIKAYGAFGGDNDLLTIDSPMFLTNGVASTTGVTLTKTGDYSATNVTEVQQVSLKNGPTGGTFTLKYGADTTAGLAYNISAAAMATALNGLTSIGAAGVSVAGNAGGPWTVTFGGTAFNTGAVVNLLFGDATSLTGGAVVVEQSQPPLPRVNETQLVEFNRTPEGGTFTLTFNAETTGAIAYNATAATVQTALIALATPVTDDISVTGNAGGPYAVEFTGNYAASNVAIMTGSGVSLTATDAQAVTVTAITTATGTNWVSNVNNWSLGTLPVDSDIIVFKDSSVNVSFGLDALTNVTPATIEQWASFTGLLGLPDINALNGEYREYRDKYFQIGLAADAVTIEVQIGYGEGNGSTLCRYDFGDCPYNMHVQRTATVQDNDKTAVQVKGGTAASTANVTRGSVGFALDPNETATLGTVRMDRAEEGAECSVIVGPQTTLTNVLKYDGDLELNAAPSSSFVQYAGDTTFNGTAAISGPLIYGGNFFHNSSGNLNGAAVVSGNGQYIFDLDLRPKTVANPIDVYGDLADVVDGNKVASTTGTSPAGLIVDYNFTTRNKALGVNYRLTRAATA